MLTIKTYKIYKY